LSVLNENNNMPGVIIDYEKELGQDFDSSHWGETDSIVVYGTAFDGAPGVAIKLYNPDMARYLFGNSYNSETRQSASLVAAVQDIYDRGGRTIYGVRVSGKTLYKDYRFCDGFDGYRLRVKSLYPNNRIKNCAMYLDLRSGMEKIKLYKPAAKATLNEKANGMVDNADSILEVVMELNLENGVSRDSKLVDLIDLFNKHKYNNVLRLQIVTKEGVDVTSTPEVREIAVGSCFPGVYILGRDMSLCTPYTNLSTSIVIDETSAKPYNSFEGKYFSTLKFNSDISVEYPIYAANYDDLQDVLRNVNITTVKDYDFLKTAGVIDRAFRKDDVDYEETGLSKFELYKRLGQGYATTAMAVPRGKKNGVERKPRIIETPADNPNHIVGIREGIYANMANADIKFRVLACANADDKITGKIPKADEFKVAVPNTLKLLGSSEQNALIVGTPIVDSKDMTKPRNYSVEFHCIDEDDMSVDSIEEIYATKVAPVVASVELAAGVSPTPQNLVDAVVAAAGDQELPAGSDVMVKENGVMTYHLVRYLNKNEIQILDNAGLQGELFCVADNILEGNLVNGSVVFTQLVGTDNGANFAPATAQFEYKSKDYMLIKSAEEVFVAKINQTSADISVTPIGLLSDMLGDNDDATLVYTESLPLGQSRIIVTTAATDFMSLEEFCSILQEDPALGHIFNFELTDFGYEQKDEYLEDLKIEPNADAGSVLNNIFYWENGATKPAPAVGAVVVGGAASYPNGVTTILSEDRSISYDYGMFIPYKTADSFARQFAQHCARTSLITGNTHGFVGLAPLTDTTLASVNRRVEEVSSTNWSLHAKKYNGRDMLDGENMPYDVGRFISMTMFQYNVAGKDGFLYKSNGAAGYAGMVSTLPLDRSSTMQEIDLLDADYFLSSTQMEALMSKGVVILVDSLSKGICIADGTTMANSDQYAQRLMVVKILDHCGERIRRAAEPFIGLVNSLENRNSLKTAIDSTLKEITGKLIYTYTFTILNETTYTADSKLDIYYEIFPINEIRTVNNSITVRKSA